MDPRTLARLCALLGGLAWGLRWLLAALEVPAGAEAAAYWAGLLLLAVGIAGTGAGLVSSSARWLRAVVAVALPLLVWSVLEVIHDAADDVVVDGVLGIAAVLVWGVALLRARGRSGPPRTRRPTGSHAR